MCRNSNATRNIITARHYFFAVEKRVHINFALVYEFLRYVGFCYIDKHLPEYCRLNVLLLRKVVDETFLLIEGCVRAVFAVAMKERCHVKIILLYSDRRIVNGMNNQQSGVRYSWDGMKTYGMIERSSPSELCTIVL